MSDTDRDTEIDLIRDLLAELEATGLGDSSAWCHLMRSLIESLEQSERDC